MYVQKSRVRDTMCTRGTKSWLQSASLESSKAEDDGAQAEAEPLFPVSGRSLLMQRLLSLRGCTRHLSTSMHCKRQKTPEDQKDTAYWDKRRRNNEAAKRSRERRRFHDFMLEGQLLALSKENTKLRAEMLWLQCHFGLAAECSTGPRASFQHPMPGPSTPSLWGLLGDSEGVGELLQGSRLSWAALCQGSGTGVGRHGLPGYFRSTNPAHYLDSHHSLQRPFLLPAHQPEKPGRFEKAQQQLSNGAVAGESETPDNHWRYSTKESPEGPELRTCSRLSCPSLPQSRLLSNLISSSICRSGILLPWGATAMHPPPFYYNTPICLPQMPEPQEQD
ncbi:hypothetical protein GN956_G3364 [Arapaima gigas]